MYQGLIQRLTELEDLEMLYCYFQWTVF